MGWLNICKLVLHTINPNVAPVLTDISNQTMTEDNSLSLNIAATDADNDQLTYSITGGSSETVSASIDGTNNAYTSLKLFYNNSFKFCIESSRYFW